MEIYYQHNLKLLEHAKNDMLQLKEKEKEEIIKEKELEISIYQQRVNTYSNILNKIHDKVGTILKTDIYNRLIYITKHPSVKVTDNEWDSLRQEFQNHFADFHSFLFYRYRLTDEDYRKSKIGRASCRERV